MKKIALLLFSFTLAIGLFYPTNQDTASAAFSYKKGDILITDRTSSKGITGHTAIYIGKNQVLHTSGWKSEPHPKVMSLSSWLKRYDKRVKVLRYKSSKVAGKAADQAVKAFKGKKIKYSITTNPKNISKTYCSELVWYSYWKAGVTYKISHYSGKNGKTTWITPAVIMPYDYLDSKDFKKNGFTLVDKKY